jgi:hypothetical protein
MNLQERIEILKWLGEYMNSDTPAWTAAKERAGHLNGWFIPEFIDLSVDNIIRHMLQKPLLESFCAQYAVPPAPAALKTVGIVMAGNIPLVGFHDFLCVFLSGHRQVIKLPEKDNLLLKHLVEAMTARQPAVAERVSFAEMLKNLDAYIATGSNNSSRYFEQYFAKYPHIIRRNRTSVAVLTGTESPEALSLLAGDVHLYFGLGCRNVTKLLVPKGYDFVPMLDAFNRYNWMENHNKYKNNYDYNLALYILNKQLYMTNSSILLIESPQPFTPVSQLNYEFYDDKAALQKILEEGNTDIQCVVGEGFTPFGQAQQPALTQYADGADTMAFLQGLN